jgi:hypothetical protein
VSVASESPKGAEIAAERGGSSQTEKKKHGARKHSHNPRLQKPKTNGAHFIFCTTTASATSATKNQEAHIKFSGFSIFLELVHFHFAEFFNRKIGNIWFWFLFRNSFIGGGLFWRFHFDIFSSLEETS